MKGLKGTWWWFFFSLRGRKGKLCSFLNYTLFLWPLVLSNGTLLAWRTGTEGWHHMILEGKTWPSSLVCLMTAWHTGWTTATFQINILYRHLKSLLKIKIGIGSVILPLWSHCEHMFHILEYSSHVVWLNISKKLKWKNAPKKLEEFI